VDFANKTPLRKVTETKRATARTKVANSKQFNSIQGIARRVSLYVAENPRRGLQGGGDGCAHYPPSQKKRKEKKKDEPRVSGLVQNARRPYPPNKNEENTSKHCSSRFVASGVGIIQWFPFLRRNET
jgi:hypothetical protein